MRFIIQNNGEINEDICNRIRGDWMKWRDASRIFYNRCISWRPKGIFYRVTIRHIMLYYLAYWAINACVVKPKKYIK